MSKTIIAVLIISILMLNILNADERLNKSNNKQYNISVCAIFKNEAKYLKEWIEFHRLVGVDHFYLYNVGSTDRYMDVLKSYMREGIVTVIQWPDLSKNQIDDMWALGTQIPAYENAIRVTAFKKTKWLVFIDVDEFLLPIDGNSLSEVVEKYKEFPGIVLSRLYFDASRVDILPKRYLVVETTEMTTPPELNILKSIDKLIFKPDLCTYFTWPPYHFIFKDDQEPIKLSKWEMRINHYVYRNVGSLHARNYKGYMQMDPRMYQTEVDELLKSGYQIQDHEIDRFVPILRKKMGY